MGLGTGPVHLILISDHSSEIRSIFSFFYFVQLYFFPNECPGVNINSEFYNVNDQGINCHHCSHYSIIEIVVARLPLMTYGLKLSLEALILKYKNFNLSFKEII